MCREGIVYVSSCGVQMVALLILQYGNEMYSTTTIVFKLWLLLRNYNFILLQFIYNN